MVASQRQGRSRDRASSAPPAAPPGLMTMDRLVQELAPGCHFHQLFQHLGDIRLVVKDRSGRFIFVSDNALIPHGLHHPEEMLGKTDFDLNPRTLAQAYRDDDDRVYRTGRPLLNRVELCFNDKGLLDWVVTSKFPLSDRAGVIIGLAVTIQKYRGLALLPAFHGGLSRVVAYIAAHLGEPLPSQRLAAILQVSPRQLQRQFLDGCGMSPTAFIIRARLSRACEWLRDRPLSIAAVAIELGFYDQSAFTRLFRKYLGLTPREFRRRCSRQQTGA